MKSLSMAHGRFRWRETGTGDPLVLLHGWSMSHAVFDELATLLEGDFRLLIPDLPGHGRSDPLEPCSFKAMAQLLKDWLAEIGCQKVTLLGWSLGGQLALQLASETTTLIERLILISSTACFCARPDWQAGLPAGELRALKRGLKRRYLATLGEFFDLQF
ncbi:MAG: alpha/beta fold hydrolase, partial [Geopsychrobacter sp.]|nr:alpha/beta fold hydrolase [Geopsychrobacter sp.]